MKQLTFAPLIAFFLLAPGCAPLLEKQELVIPETRTRVSPLLPADILDRKIGSLNMILKERDLSEKDRKIALDLVDTYKSIKKGSTSDLKKAEYRRIIHDLFECYRLIDEYYFSKEKDSDRSDLDAIPLFANKRKNILDAYLSNDFKGVINHCLDLKEAFGSEALTPEIGLLLALSLGREGMMEEAIRIGEGIARELEARPNLFQLRSHLAEWQLRLGHKEKAIRIYEKLTDSLDENEALILVLNNKISGATATKSDIITEQSSKEQTDGEGSDSNDLDTIDHLLQKVDNLIERKTFNEARFLLIKHRIRIEEGPEIEIIDQALNKVRLSEETYEREKDSRDSQRKAFLETAKNLLEENKFNEAIAKIEELNQIQEISTETEILKERAIEKLINHERNRAAKLFLSAKKTQDSAKKERYLRSSYKILETLIGKYPSSPLNKKLKSHIASVKKEMDKLEINLN